MVRAASSDRLVFPGRSRLPPHVIWRGAVSANCHDSRMAISEPLLMGPDLESVPGGRNGMAGGARASRPTVLCLLDRRTTLRQVFCDLERIDLPFSGPDRRVWRHRLSISCAPGPCVVGVNGVFGERLCEVANRHGAEVVRVDGEWGESLDPERVLAPTVTGHVAVVHGGDLHGVRNE